MKNRPAGSTEDVVNRAYEQMGGVKNVAHHCSVLGENKSKTQLYAYTDPDERDQITFDLMRRLVMLTGCTAPAEDLAALAGGFFVPGQVDEASLHVLASKSAKEQGEFVSALFEAMHDPSKRRKALKELQEFMHVLASLHTVLSSEQPTAVVIPIKGEVA